MDTASLAPIDIWEKQPDETGKAYGAFLYYMKLPPDIRSIQRAIKEKNGAVTSSTIRLWSKWSSQHSWVHRASSWDYEQERQRALARNKAIIDMEDRHIKVAQALQQKAIERLRELDKAELNITETLRYFLEGAKMERLTLGQPNDISTSYNANLNLEETDYSVLSDTDLRKVIAQRLNKPPKDE